MCRNNVARAAFRGKDMLALFSRAHDDCTRSWRATGACWTRCSWTTMAMCRLLCTIYPDRSD